MNTILSDALGAKDELVQIRRSLHRCPEVGSDLPKTAAFVTETLRRLGYGPQEICKSGITAVLEGAKPGKTLMLRADMDALRLREQAPVSFAAENGNMHACGHDMHTAMLLGAAKLLMARREEIPGKVKLVFQPNEEGFGGAKAMVQAGVLEQPKVDAAMALHVCSGIPSGRVLAGTGTVMAGCTFFRIRISGTGCHGATPERGVDPINIAAHIHLSLQEILAREISPFTPAVLTVGRLSAGDAPNIIPQEALLEGSVRTMDPETDKLICGRIAEIATRTAELFRGTAVMEELSSVPPLRNDAQLVTQMTGFLGEIHDPAQIVTFENGGTGSEDFAVISRLVPCCYLLLGAGTPRENPVFGQPMHNEKVVFNEDVLPLGSAILAHCAMRWLQNNGSDL